MPSSSSSTANGGGGGGHSLASVIGHYQRKMQRHPDEPEVLRHALAKLSRLDGISIAVLQDTGVGRVVNGLRKSGDAEVAAAARELVARWKEIVASEEEREQEEEEAPQDREAEREVRPSQDEQDDEEPSRPPSPSSPPPPSPPPSPERRDPYHSDDEDNTQHEAIPSFNSDREEEPEPEPEVRPKSHHHSQHREPTSNSHAAQSASSSSSSSREHHHHHKKSSKSSRHERDRDNGGEHHHRERKKSKKSSRDREAPSSSSTAATTAATTSSSSSSSRHHKHKDSKRDRDKDRSRSSNSSKHRESSAFDAALGAEPGSSRPKKSKKKEKERTKSLSPAPSSSTTNGHAAIAPPAGLNPNYKPLPAVKEESSRKSTAPAAFSSQDETLSMLMRSRGEKNRTAVYSGNKRTGYFGTIPTLHEMCIRLLQEHVESIEECGGLPFEILEPVLERAAPATLHRIEEFNTYLLEDTAGLWERHCRRHFPKQNREEMETWRDLFERCTEERERKLEGLKSRLKGSAEKEREAQKKTKLAYVGLNAKPPRSVRAAQARNGTAGSTLAASGVAGVKRPAVMPPAPVAAGPPKKPKVAPMMAKTLRMVRGFKSGFRR